MGKAKFSVSYELLSQMLHLPPGTKITWIRDKESDVFPYTFDVYVEHSDLPEMVHGDDWSQVEPIIIKQEPTVFGGWGLKPQERKYGNNVVTCEFNLRHQMWRLLINGRETFYNDDNELLQWPTQREALDWFDRKIIANEEGGSE